MLSRESTVSPLRKALSTTIVSFGTSQRHLSPSSVSCFVLPAAVKGTLDGLESTLQPESTKSTSQKVRPTSMLPLDVLARH